jgi:hypothetical protein
MPEAITLYLLGVWIVVGLCVGFGWGLGQWVAGRLTR